MFRERLEDLIFSEPTDDHGDYCQQCGEYFRFGHEGERRHCSEACLQLMLDGREERVRRFLSKLTPEQRSKYLSKG